MAVEVLRRARGGGNGRNGGPTGASTTETVITCSGDLEDPTFPRRFRSILKELRNVICRGSEDRLRVRKLEPWNSVRVTFSIAVEAAERLRALAETGDELLARLGILSVQLASGQVISLRLSAPPTPPNVVAPPPAAIPPLVNSVPPSTPRFPFNSMAQASAIVTREAKACTSGSHYPPPPYPEHKPPEVTQASPLLVNLLQTDQGPSPGPRLTGGVRPPAYPRGGLPPPPYGIRQPSTSGGSATPGSSTSHLAPPPPPPVAVTSSQSTSLLPDHLGTTHLHLHLPGSSGVVPQAPVPQAQVPLHHLPQQHLLTGIQSVPSTSSPSLPSSLPHTSAASSSSASQQMEVCEKVASPPGPTGEGSSSSGGKSVQYLINPLTGVLEPMSSSSESEGESEAEVPPPAAAVPPPAVVVPFPAVVVPPPAAAVSVRRPSFTLAAVECAAAEPPSRPPSVPPPPPQVCYPQEVAGCTQVATSPDEPPPAPARITTSTPLVGQQENSSSSSSSASSRSVEEAAPPPPKSEEKIKLRLKLEKSESYNVPPSYKAESGSSEPRVPPLHISLRGRPAVVSRKEKRVRKEERREERRDELPQGSCQFPSEAEVASILRSVPTTAGKLLNTSVVNTRRKREKKKIYPRSIPRVEEKLKKAGGSLLKSVVKSAAKEVRMMTAQRMTKPLNQIKKNISSSSTSSLGSTGKPPVSADSDYSRVAPVNNKYTTSTKLSSTVTEPQDHPVVTSQAPGRGVAPTTGVVSTSGSQGDDSGIESMDALSEKSPNQGDSPIRKEDKKEKKEEEAIEDPVPIRLTPALYTYSNPEKQREETPSPTPSLEDKKEEQDGRYSGKSLLEQLLIDLPNGGSELLERRASRNHRRSSDRSPTPGLKRIRRASESSTASHEDLPTPRPNKRKCSENAAELIKACMGVEESKRDEDSTSLTASIKSNRGDSIESSDDDEMKRKEEDRLGSKEDEDKNRVSVPNSRRSIRQAEAKERPSVVMSRRPSKSMIGGKKNRDEEALRRRRSSKEK